MFSPTENVLNLFQVEMRDAVDGVDETEQQVGAGQTHDEVVARLTQMSVSHHRPAHSRRRYWPAIREILKENQSECALRAMQIAYV